MMKKFIRHDLGSTGLRLEKWDTQPRVGVCVGNARYFRIFEIAQKMVCFGQISMF